MSGHGSPPNWEVYVQLNFELPEPGPDGAVRELKGMVSSHKTPDYKGGQKGGTGKPIEPRPLGDFEYATLERLLPIYEEKLKALWATKSTGQMGQSPSNQITAGNEGTANGVSEEVQTLRGDNEKLRKDNEQLW